MIQNPLKNSGYKKNEGLVTNFNHLADASYIRKMKRVFGIDASLKDCLDIVEELKQREADAQTKDLLHQNKETSQRV